MQIEFKRSTNRKTTTTATITARTTTKKTTNNWEREIRKAIEGQKEKKRE